MEISVCIITRNEEKKLEKCLRALKPYPWEIVVTDTGSDDGSREMAAKFADRVCGFTWCDDFAGAKNFAVSKASNDMVLVLDTDEYLEMPEPEEFPAFLDRVEQNPGKIGRIRRINGYEENGEWCENQEYINRVFDRRLFRYEGRIHEQLVPVEQTGNIMEAAKKNAAPGTDGTRSNDTYFTGLTVLHDGYNGSPEWKRKKALRNKKLLLQELAADPEDTYVLYQLGKSCFMAGECAEAVKYFEVALGYDLDPKLEYVIDMVETYGYALLQTGQVETALQFEGLLQEFGNTADFCFLMGLIYMNNELFEEAVDSFLKAASYPEAKAKGANSYKAYYNAGVVRECLGDREQATEFYRKCGDYEKAVTRLAALTQR